MSGPLPCGPPWGGTGGARGMFGLSRLAMFSSTRVIVWVSVHIYADLSCASDKLCSLSAENSTATNLTQLEPHSDLSRSTAFHCVT